MTSLIVLLGAMSAGAVHVVSGPDHLAAVLPLAVRDRAAAARTGAMWGLGHGLGVVVLGGLGQLLRGRVELDGVSGLAELAVGVLLVVLGVRTMLGARGLVVHSHAHPHEHTHLHVHLEDPTVGQEDHPLRGAHAGHSHSALGFGLLHGVAGGGHLFGALPSLALGPASAALYLAGYVAAAVGVMTAFAAGAGALVPPARLRLATTLCGALAVGVGVAWVGASL